jgi:hypothetical protein
MPLALPPGHRITIEIDGDKPLGITVTAYRGDEWLGLATVDSLDGVGRLQEIVDMLTKRGLKLSVKK